MENIMLHNLFGNVETKQCCTCKEHKLLKEFGKYSRAKDGLKSYCKVCAKATLKKTRDKKKRSNQCLDCSRPTTVGQFCTYHYVDRALRSVGKNHNAPILNKRQVLHLINISGLTNSITTICPVSKQTITLGENASICHIKPYSECRNARQWHSLNNIYIGSLQLNLSQHQHGGNAKQTDAQRWRSTGVEAIRRNQSSAAGGNQLGIKLQEIFESRTQWVCPYLGYTLTSINDLSLDHIIPTSQGGTNDLSNLQFISREANHRKSNKTHKEFCRQLGLDPTEHPPNRLG